MGEILQIEYRCGQPVKHHGRILTPFNRVVSLRFAGRSFGAVWNKPSSLLVQQPDGSEQILPIPDPTRRTMIVILASGLFIWLIARLWVVRRHAV